MKKIFLSSMILCLSFGVFAQPMNIDYLQTGKNNSFEVPATHSLVVIIPSGTITQQAQCIVQRATQQPYAKKDFDFAFFDSAFVLIQKFPLQTKQDSIAIKNLKEWRSCLSKEGNLIPEQQYADFLHRAKSYGITISYNEVSPQYDLIQLEEIPFQIVKETYGKGKKKIEIPQGFYLILPKKQPLN